MKTIRNIMQKNITQIIHIYLFTNKYTQNNNTVPRKTYFMLNFWQLNVLLRALFCKTQSQFVIFGSYTYRFTSYICSLSHRLGSVVVIFYTSELECSQLFKFQILHRTKNVQFLLQCPSFFFHANIFRVEKRSVQWTTRVIKNKLRRAY